MGPARPFFISCVKRVASIMCPPRIQLYLHIPSRPVMNPASFFAALAPFGMCLLSPFWCRLYPLTPSLLRTSEFLQSTRLQRPTSPTLCRRRTSQFCLRRIEVAKNMRASNRKSTQLRTENDSVRVFYAHCPARIHTIMRTQLLFVMQSCSSRFTLLLLKVHTLCAQGIATARRASHNVDIGVSPPREVVQLEAENMSIRVFCPHSQGVQLSMFSFRHQRTSCSSARRGDLRDRSASAFFFFFCLSRSFVG